MGKPPTGVWSWHGFGPRFERCGWDTSEPASGLEQAIKKAVSGSRSSHSPERKEGMLTFTRQNSGAVLCGSAACWEVAVGKGAAAACPPLCEAAGWLPGQMLTNCIRKEVGGNIADSDPCFKNPEPG